MTLQRVMASGAARGGAALQRVLHKEQDIDALAVELLRTSTSDWTPAYLASLIKRNEVPEKYIQDCLGYVFKHPILISIQKEQFLTATRTARPDLWRLMVTPTGDAWLEHAMLDLGKALPGGMMAHVMGR